MNGIESLFSGFRTTASGMAAERARADIIASNIANAHTTRMPDGSGPYRRQRVHFEPILKKYEGGRTEVTGVRVSEVSKDMQTPFEVIHDPGHPHADAAGNVSMPNVRPVIEMADMITAMRAYDANVTAQQTFVTMAERALRLMQ